LVVSFIRFSLMLFVKQGVIRLSFYNISVMEPGLLPAKVPLKY
jgi:hypothetical protein